MPEAYRVGFVRRSGIVALPDAATRSASRPSSSGAPHAPATIDPACLGVAALRRCRPRAERRPRHPARPRQGEAGPSRRSGRDREAFDRRQGSRARHRALGAWREGRWLRGRQGDGRRVLGDLVRTVQGEHAASHRAAEAVRRSGRHHHRDQRRGSREGLDLPRHRRVEGEGPVHPRHRSRSLQPQQLHAGRRPARHPDRVRGRSGRRGRVDRPPDEHGRAARQDRRRRMGREGLWRAVGA